MVNLQKLLTKVLNVFRFKSAMGSNFVFLQGSGEITGKEVYLLYNKQFVFIWGYVYSPSWTGTTSQRQAIRCDVPTDVPAFEIQHGILTRTLGQPSSENIDRGAIWCDGNGKLMVQKYFFAVPPATGKGIEFIINPIMIPLNTSGGYNSCWNSNAYSHRKVVGAW